MHSNGDGGNTSVMMENCSSGDHIHSNTTWMGSCLIGLLINIFCVAANRMTKTQKILLKIFNKVCAIKYNCTNKWLKQNMTRCNDTPKTTKMTLMLSLYDLKTR